MKLCVFLCVAVALADVTPPTISLSLSNPTRFDQHRDCASNKCEKKKHAAATPSASDSASTNLPSGSQVKGTFHSVTCEVQNNNCPLPKCAAYDHHDLWCKDMENGACKDFSEAKLEKWCVNRDDSTARTNAALTGAYANATSLRTECTHEFPCRERFALINLDGTPEGTASFTDVNRNQRSEWVITYAATDRAGNDAENVSYTVIFQDTQAPSLQTEFCDRNETNPLLNHLHHDDITVVPPSPKPTTVGTGTAASYVEKKCDGSITRKFAESCTECQDDLAEADRESFAKTDGCDACVHKLEPAIESWDNYDGNVTSNIRANLTAPDGTTVTNCDAGCNIDTRVLGNWHIEYFSHDNAGIYGTNETSNEVSQKVVIQVKDTRQPSIYIQAASTNSRTSFCSSADAGSLNPIYECVRADAAYADPSPAAKGEDLRESWDDSLKKFVHANVAANAGHVNNVDVLQMKKTATDLKSYTCDSTTHYVNEYVVNYDYSDTATPPLSADTVFRTVRTEDTTPPVVKLLDAQGNEGGATIVMSSGFHEHSEANGFEDQSGWSNSHDSHTNCHGHNQTACKGAAHSDGFMNYVKLSVGDSKVVRDNAADADKTMDGHFGGTNQSKWTGATCTDTCNPNPTMIATLHHGTDCSGDLVTGDHQAGALQNFPEYAPGDYSIKYTCTDGDNGDARPALMGSDCRHIQNVDATKPIIQILGSDSMVLEATHQGNYVDDGAVCYDQVDGVISQNVEVSGDVVNLAKVGTYVITYNCKDSAGNVAPTESRTVQVQQTECPKCTMSLCTSGSDHSQNNCTFDHEASFDYTDAGASCSDEIDGNVDYNVTNPVDVEVTGTYVVTYRAKNSVGLWNDDCTDPCVGNPTEQCERNYTRTINVVDTLKPIIEVKYNGNRVAIGTANDRAVHNSSINPMSKLMAESAGSANTWLMGAAAAAVAGVALLGFSHKRTEQLAVPV